MYFDWLDDSIYIPPTSKFLPLALVVEQVGYLCSFGEFMTCSTVCQLALKFNNKKIIMHVKIILNKLQLIANIL